MSFLTASDFIPLLSSLPLSTFNLLLNHISELKKERGANYDLKVDMMEMEEEKREGLVEYVKNHYRLLSMEEMKSYYYKGKKGEVEEESGNSMNNATSTNTNSYKINNNNTKNTSTPESKSNTSQTQIFIGGISKTSSYEKLSKFIIDHTGNYIDLQLKSGFAFITYSNNKEATRAISILNKTEYDGRILPVEFASTKSKALATSVLYISNLNSNITEDMIRDKFSPFGEIKTLNVPAGRGFALLNYVKIEDATAALVMNMKLLDGKPMYVMESKGNRNPLHDHDKSRKDERKDDTRTDRHNNHRRSRSRSRSRDRDYNRHDRDRRRSRSPLDPRMMRPYSMPPPPPPYYF